MSFPQARLIQKADLPCIRGKTKGRGVMPLPWCRSWMCVPSAAGVAPRPIQGQLAKPLIPTHLPMVPKAILPGNAATPFIPGAGEASLPRRWPSVTLAVGPLLQGRTDLSSTS